MRHEFRLARVIRPKMHDAAARGKKMLRVTLRFIGLGLVARGAIEPATRGFSVTN
jgi:hypothetical protein